MKEENLSFLLTLTKKAKNRRIKWNFIKNILQAANGTRQNNLQSATVSLQVVIGLYKRKETAALISQNRR